MTSRATFPFAKGHAMTMSLDQQAVGERIQGFEPLVGSTMRGKLALIVGFALVDIAAMLCYVAWGPLPEGVDPPNVPPNIFALVAISMFGMPGLYLGIRGARDLAQEARSNRLRKDYAGEPWRWDYNWNPLESSDIELSRAGQGLIALVLVAGIVAPLNYFAFTEMKSAMPYVVVGVFDVLLLLGLGTTAYRLAARVVHGRSRIRYRQFPLPLGETIDLTLIPQGPMHDVDSLACTLRCIEERYETRRTPNAGPNGTTTNTTTVAGFVRYAEETTVDRHQLVTGGSGVDLAFNLPDDPLLRTRLSGQPPMYWELSVTGERSGIDYRKRFLLPVY